MARTMAAALVALALDRMVGLRERVPPGWAAPAHGRKIDDQTRMRLTAFTGNTNWAMEDLSVVQEEWRRAERRQCDGKVERRRDHKHMHMHGDSPGQNAWNAHRKETAGYRHRSSLSPCAQHMSAGMHRHGAASEGGEGRHGDVGRTTRVSDTTDERCRAPRSAADAMGSRPQEGGRRWPQPRARGTTSARGWMMPTSVRAAGELNGTQTGAGDVTDTKRQRTGERAKECTTIAAVCRASDAGMMVREAVQRGRKKRGRVAGMAKAGCERSHAVGVRIDRRGAGASTRVQVRGDTAWESGRRGNLGRQISGGGTRTNRMCAGTDVPEWSGAISGRYGRDRECEGNRPDIRAQEQFRAHKKAKSAQSLRCEEKRERSQEREPSKRGGAGYAQRARQHPAVTEGMCTRDDAAPGHAPTLPDCVCAWRSPRAHAHCPTGTATVSMQGAQAQSVQTTGAPAGKMRRSAPTRAGAQRRTCDLRRRVRVHVWGGSEQQTADPDTSPLPQDKRSPAGAATTQRDGATLGASNGSDPRATPRRRRQRKRCAEAQHTRARRAQLERATDRSTASSARLTTTSSRPTRR